MMEPLFTKKEAAAYLKVSERTVDREIARLGLTIHRVGRAVRIPESSLQKMLGMVPHTVDVPRKSGNG